MSEEDKKVPTTDELAAQIADPTFREMFRREDEAYMSMGAEDGPTHLIVPGETYRPRSSSALTPQEAADLAIPGGLTVVAVHPIIETRAAKLSKPWNRAETGTGITTDPKAAGEMGWQLVDDVRFDALERGGFFGRDAKEIMGELNAIDLDYPPATAIADWSVPPGDITGDPVKMDTPFTIADPRPPTEAEIAYGHSLSAATKTPSRKKPVPLAPLDEEDGA